MNDWQKKIPAAVEYITREVKRTQGTPKNLQLDHIDEAGYWFSYELAIDIGRQIFRVRHTELEE